MPEAGDALRFWGWLFLGLYMLAMIGFGVVGMRRVKNSDDFATARGGYGPWFLSFALVATTASGGTFIGLPALTYTAGFPALWYQLVYPVGVYAGVLVCLRAVRRAGVRFGTRSMPEFLGERYNSGFLRMAVAIFSLLLIFYLAAQLLSAAVMFTRMLGLDVLPALLVTSALLLVYIVIGGAHADILTDGVQGALMLLLALVISWMFFTGFGVDGGFDGMLAKLRARDPVLVQVLHDSHPLFNSWWDVFCIFAAHAPLGLLPHIGNKLWALRSDSDQWRFIAVSFVFGMLLASLGFGGIMARALLGDALLAEGATANDAIPALFITLLPAWLAGLIGAGVLAAVMSTADGLLISGSQIFANDIYRLGIAPRQAARRSEAEVDRTALVISRVATVVIMAAAVWLAWASQQMNVALLLWAGIGGMMAATAGPMFVGVLWRRATAAGALAGFFAGGACFIVLKAGLLSPFAGQPGALGWLAAQESNPYSCATLGALLSIALVIGVSCFTRPPDPQWMARVLPAPASRG